MALLGLARGAGGVVLLSRRSAADTNIHAPSGAIIAVGAALLLLGLVLTVSAVGVFRGQRRFWRLGIICTIAFVVDGGINGAVLYGRPGDGGTIANVIVAALILACLFLGKGAPPNHPA